MELDRNHESFPAKLLSENLKPSIKKIWCQGELDRQIFAKCAAIVGSRKISRYGKQILGEIVPRLCASGYTIVSGMMYGVDQEAHKLALECGGRTIAVLGYGFGVRQEEGTVKMGERIAQERGLVISEYPPGTVPQVWMFPQRNRIVVGLSDIVIVAEAGEKSGSLNTAGWAGRQRKKLYAIPGPIFSPTAAGTNRLISEGLAASLTLEELTMVTGAACEKDLLSPEMAKKLKNGEREIVTLLKVNGPMSVNEIARSLGVNAGELLGSLMTLEIGGLVSDERGIWRAG